MSDRGEESGASAEQRAVGYGAGMSARRLVVRARDVVFVKGVIEAHDGLAHVFAEHGGDLVVAAACGREAELDEVVADLARELDGFTRAVEDA